jgi:acyl-coenzyme A thioesterase PaaI-like protein
MSADEIAKLLAVEFPQAFYPGCGHSIERVEHGDIRVRWTFEEAALRPGGTVSGPTMMELADFAMYVAVFSVVGPQPARTDLIADARLMKVGKRLAVGEVTIYSEGTEEPVAHVTATYSIPQAR